MTLFFSRRSYNASKKQFTNNAAELTRYVSIAGTQPGSGGWRGHMLQRAEWLRQVRAQAQTPDVLIYVHGFNTRQSDMLARAVKIEAGLRAHGYGGAVVSYDWPSDGSVLRYDQDKLDAKKTAPFLATDGIWPLLAMSPRPRVHLLAHSMGGYLMLRGFAPFGDSDGPGAGGWTLDQIMFASADVHRNTLQRGAANALLMSHRSKRFTNYYSADDGVLKLSSKIVHGTRKRVGRSGIPQRIASDHVDVSCTAQYRRDAKPVDSGRAYSHRWWFDNDGFYEDMALTIKGTAKTAMTTRYTTTGTDYALVT